MEFPEFEQAADDILERLQNPLNAADREVARRAIAKLNELTARGLAATSAQLPPLINEAQAVYATLATIADTSRAEITTMVVEKIVQVVGGVTGRVLQLV